MIICSWDVGIKHLAYCIMGYRPLDEKIKFPIYGWNSINLIDDVPLICNKENCSKPAKHVFMDGDMKIYYCGMHQQCFMNHIPKGTNYIFFRNNSKNGCSVAKCTRKAIGCKQNVVDGNKIYLCSLHKKQHDYDNDNIYKLIKYNCHYDNCDKKATVYSIIDDNKIYCCAKHKIKNKDVFKNDDKCVYDECGSKATYCENGNFYCSHHRNMLVADASVDIIDIAIQKKAEAVNLDTLLKQLILKLDSIPEILNVDTVVIENQPSLKNPKMKTIATAIYSYFLIRGVLDKNIKNVCFTSPINKLNIDIKDAVIIKSNKEIDASNDNKYKATKQLGIKYCKQLIQFDEPSIKLLAKHTKADDLCDAMLQGAYYLIKNT